MQQALERLAGERLQTLPPHVSLAMLVADAQTRELRAAYAGAWGDQGRAGALDLTQAVRSPGSALKPFIYALAFQDGIVAPDTVLADLPRRYGAYAPENFDRGFAGRVTAADALRRSLNLPAVALLDRVGPLRFAAALRAAGAPVSLPEGADPSLPLALGGAGLTLRRAASSTPRWRRMEASPRCISCRVRPCPPCRFSPPMPQRSAASVLTRDFPAGGPKGVAWKTGTSWGGRDAWAFGFDARHVAAVWVGRPDGTPMPGATGASLALPLLARVFDLLPPAPRQPAPLPADPGPKPAVVGMDALRLLFPPSGAVLSEDGSVTIRAMGGRRPLTFLVDGAPIAAEPARREAAWRPPGPGLLPGDRARTPRAPPHAPRSRCAEAWDLSEFSRAAALLALSSCAGFGGCTVEKWAELPVRLYQSIPLVQVSINGRPVRARARYGRSAHARHFRRRAASRAHSGPQRAMVMRGIGGAMLNWEAKPESFTFADIGVRPMTVMVAPIALPALDGIQPDGLLGADVLSALDVDLDLPHGKVGFYRARTCPAGPPWSEPYATIAARRTARNALLMPVSLNGAPDPGGAG